ncbi:uncharacterized protein LOC135393283 [Ornithodoros turicata]|uniref:uncharacterized protein LOC135393283 n=1 Tax=Ornithodoros turicata TaxID=34597 RepID=UPI003139001D
MGRLKLKENVGDDSTSAGALRGPKNSAMRKLWKAKLRIGKPLTSFMNVCSEHFGRDDFFWHNVDHSIWTPRLRRLKKTAVPSENLPKRSHDSVHTSAQKASAVSREARALARTSRLTDTRGSNESPQNIEPAECESGSAVCDSDSVQLSSLELPRTTKDDGVCEQEYASVQADSMEQKLRKLTLADLTSSKGALQKFTGVPSFELLNKIVHHVDNFSGTKAKSSTNSRVHLVLVRLKTGLSFNCMSPLFGVSEASVHRYFSSTLPILAQVMRAALSWPSKEEVMQNMPLCFSSFPRVRVVLDGTEVQIEKSQCLACRIKTYSHYKGCHTVKFLVGVSPGGLITHISEGFEGRASDKTTIEQSGILKKLSAYKDDVMVDKGFAIDVACSESNIGLIRPPFLRKKQQFSVQEAKET